MGKRPTMEEWFSHLEVTLGERANVFNTIKRLNKRLDYWDEILLNYDKKLVIEPETPHEHELVEHPWGGKVCTRCAESFYGLDNVS